MVYGIEQSSSLLKNLTLLGSWFSLLTMVVFQLSQQAGKHITKKCMENVYVCMYVYTYIIKYVLINKCMYFYIYYCLFLCNCRYIIYNNSALDFGWRESCLAA